ncbi:MAG TPA: hypothetical protein VNL38_02015, partial [Candidatus Nitrosotenuis sp.]|nr:hypothetical protein [Candidatus Nitrosotenuis sp.]
FADSSCFVIGKRPLRPPFHRWREAHEQREPRSIPTNSTDCSTWIVPQPGTSPNPSEENDSAQKTIVIYPDSQVGEAGELLRDMRRALTAEEK